MCISGSYLVIGPQQVHLRKASAKCEKSDIERQSKDQGITEFVILNLS